MTAVPEQGCASPLELFNGIAAQGERVKALKAGKASKVCHRVRVPAPRRVFGPRHPEADRPSNWRIQAVRLRLFSPSSTLPMYGVEREATEMAQPSTPARPIPCSQKQPFQFCCIYRLISTALSLKITLTVLFLVDSQIRGFYCRS